MPGGWTLNEKQNFNGVAAVDDLGILLEALRYRVNDTSKGALPWRAIPYVD